MQGDIEEKVFEIFRKYLFRDLTQCEDPFSESIFGEKIALLPAEAYFLLVKIEEEFSIKFSNDVVIERRFNYLKIKLENERYFRAFLDIVSNVWKSPIPFSAKTVHFLQS